MRVKFNMPGCTDQDYAGSLYTEREEMMTAAKRNAERVPTKFKVAAGVREKDGIVAKGNMVKNLVNPAK